MSDPKHIVLTGASSGIGAALTQALAAEGHRLYVCARRRDRLDEVTQHGNLAFGWPCDVSDEGQVIEFRRQVRQRTATVDVLINCAGRLGAIGPVLETDSEEWLDTIKDNLFGTYLMVKHLVPLMTASSSPRVVNFSGGGAFGPFPNYSAYAVSKAAIVRLTETLAVELAPRGVAVNAVAPGFVATEIHDATLAVGVKMAGEGYFQETTEKLSQGAVPMEVPVDCVRFLVSDQADGLTGKTLSASFDPWCTREFSQSIEEISQSDLYTMRRMNLVNIPEGSLRTSLEAASRTTG